MKMVQYNKRQGFITLWKYLKLLQSKIFYNAFHFVVQFPRSQVRLFFDLFRSILLLMYFYFYFKYLRGILWSALTCKQYGLTTWFPSPQTADKISNKSL